MDTDSDVALEIDWRFFEKDKAKAIDIRANQTLLYQVLKNLYKNSEYAMEFQGHVDIRFTEETIGGFFAEQYHANDGRYFVVEISDSGSGMTKEQIDNAFSAFYTTKDESTGTGLGLYVCYDIMKKMNGFITAESMMGMGTAFRMYFPIIE
jgi:signal transduction histidine kinase